MPRQRGMRTKFAVASAACVAATVGFWVRGIEWHHVDPAPVASVKRAASPEAAKPASLALDHPTAQHNRSLGNRNLFAYREAPAPIERVAYIAPPPVMVERAIAPPPVVVEEKPRLRFTSRYIGKFGPDRNPIAAFTRDGQVTTVRVGERVDEHFVLRRIGIESVEVEARDAGETITQQVPLG
ncbi:MAG TPA: hypothetical protein VF608_00035 [Thermoanaerobaculia bacterium]